MTLADKKLRTLLRRDFIATYRDTTGEKSAGGSFAHEPKEPAPHCIRGNGESNVQLLVLAPDGRLLSVVTGFIEAKDLVEELTFARDLLRAKEPLTKERVRNAHEAFDRRLADRTFEGPLSDWSKRRARLDHRFAAKHALMPIARFRPEDLVGQGTNFFGSRKGKVELRKTVGRAPELPDR
ncbi:MAG: hypothetical protein AAGD14_17760 [Planctomycetota bacterium]